MNTTEKPRIPKSTPRPRTRTAPRRRPTREDIIRAFSIAEVVRAAEAEGLTYGRYVAKYDL